MMELSKKIKIENTTNLLELGTREFVKNYANQLGKQFKEIPEAIKNGEYLPIPCQGMKLSDIFIFSSEKFMGIKLCRSGIPIFESKFLETNWHNIPFRPNITVDKNELQISVVNDVSTVNSCIIYYVYEELKISEFDKEKVSYDIEMFAKYLEKNIKYSRFIVEPKQFVLLTGPFCELNISNLIICSDQKITRVEIQAYGVPVLEDVFPETNIYNAQFIPNVSMCTGGFRELYLKTDAQKTSMVDVYALHDDKFIPIKEIQEKRYYLSYNEFRQIGPYKIKQMRF